MKTGYAIKDLILCALASITLPCVAQISDDVVRLGVINDQSGPYSALSGPGSVLAVQMAVEDMKGQLGGIKVEVLVADHQNKADLGVTIARRWFDVDKVDAIMDVSNSAVALAIQTVIKEKNKIGMYGAIGTTELTGKQCVRTGYSWLHDSYALVSGPVRSLLKSGADTWYFVAADFAFGKNAVQVAKEILAANGGRSVGETYHPMATTDYSSFLLQAQSSDAKAVMFANGGAQLVNSMKQWKEFGMQGGKQKPVATILEISDVHAAGLDVIEGLSATTAWYWDLNEQSRAFGRRFFERFKAMPTATQAAMYSAASHYLKAVVATKTDATDAVDAKMRSTPVNDMYQKNGMLRPDGKLSHDFLLVTVKSKADSKYPWDYYKVNTVIPASDALSALSASDCPLVDKAAAKTK
ncbi:MAG: transporter permease [Variovorax sp.]|jgi:branched-chain amino acid transport system substrate-binding protein|nr:transporter permease [Variovorax sp.]